MSNKELEAVLQMIAEQQANTPADLSLEEQRAGFEDSGVQMPLPDEPHGISDIRMNGVPALKITPEGAPKDQAILYFHGGGYVFGSCLSHRHLMAKLAVDANKVCYGVDYRLAPECPFPAALEDALSAYDWLLQDQGVEPSNVVLAGDSAGGGLTQSLLLSLKERGMSLPAGSVLFSPWVDLSLKATPERSDPTKDPMVTQEHLNELSKLYVGKEDCQSQLISPVTGDFSNFPPLYVQAGKEELLLDDSVQLVQKARDSGVEAQVETYPDLFHVFQYFWPLLSQGREAIREAASRANEMLA